MSVFQCCLKGNMHFGTMLVHRRCPLSSLTVFCYVCNLAHKFRYKWLTASRIERWLQKLIHETIRAQTDAEYPKFQNLLALTYLVSLRLCCKVLWNTMASIHTHGCRIIINTFSDTYFDMGSKDSLFKSGLRDNLVWHYNFHFLLI